MQVPEGRRIFSRLTVEENLRAGGLGSRDKAAKKTAETRVYDLFPVLAERRSGRLLGAQIVGRQGSAKRIDVFATALWNRMTLAEMVNMDLSYAPPFSPVWDPVLIAARKAQDAVENDISAQLGAGGR